MAKEIVDDTSSDTKKKAEPVVLRGPHDYAIVQTSLEAQKEVLVKLAEKNEAQGYTREARSIKADADAIEHHILPQIRAQREMPLVTVKQLEKSIGLALKPFVTRSFNGLGDPKVQLLPDAIADRQNALIEKLVTRVTLYVVEVAEEAYNQGVAAREQSAESLAMRSIKTLSAQDVS